MRTTFPLVAVLSLFVAMAFFSGSGFNAIVDGDRNTKSLESEVNETANESVGGFDQLSGSRSGEDEGSIVGIVVAGARNIGKLIGMFALLPVTMTNLGFPVWFAAPVGIVLELIASIGIIQFVTGRVLR